MTIVPWWNRVYALGCAALAGAHATLLAAACTGVVTWTWAFTGGVGLVAWGASAYFAARRNARLDYLIGTHDGFRQAADALRRSRCEEPEELSDEDLETALRVRREQRGVEVAE